MKEDPPINDSFEMKRLTGVHSLDQHKESLNSTLPREKDENDPPNKESRFSRPPPLSQLVAVDLQNVSMRLRDRRQTAEPEFDEFHSALHSKNLGTP